MNLYIRQKVFSWRDRFSIYDEQQRPVYTAYSEILSIGKKLHLLDARASEVAFIREKVWSVRHRFFIQRAGRPEMEMIKRITMFRPHYVIDSLGWSVEGQFMEHDYRILDRAGHTVASIHKKWISWGDVYELSIDDNADTAMVVSVILAIDVVLLEEAAAAGAR